MHYLAQQLAEPRRRAMMAAASGIELPTASPPSPRFIPHRNEGDGADRHIWIGERGAIWLKQGTFSNPAASMQGFDSEQRTYIGPRGGLWLRIGWWTDVIRVPSWLHEGPEVPRAVARDLAPPGPTGIPPPGIPQQHSATGFALLPMIPMPHEGMWRPAGGASGRLARPTTPRAAPY